MVQDIEKEKNCRPFSFPCYLRLRGRPLIIWGEGHGADFRKRNFFFLWPSDGIFFRRPSERSIQIQYLLLSNILERDNDLDALGLSDCEVVSSQLSTRNFQRIPQRVIGWWFCYDAIVPGYQTETLFQVYQLSPSKLCTQSLYSSIRRPLSSRWSLQSEQIINMHDPGEGSGNRGMIQERGQVTGGCIEPSHGCCLRANPWDFPHLRAK